MKNGNGIGEGKYDLHVMFDDDQRTSCRHTVDHLDGLFRLFTGHAGCRFVEKDQLRLRRQGDADFQGPLPAIRQGTGRLVFDAHKADLFDDGLGLFDERPVVIGPFKKIKPQAVMRADAGKDVVKNAQLMKDIGDLE